MKLVSQVAAKTVSLVGISMPGSSAEWGWLSIGSDLQDHGQTPNLEGQTYPFLDATAEFNGPRSEEGKSRSAMRGSRVQRGRYGVNSGLSCAMLEALGQSLAPERSRQGAFRE